MYCIVLYCIVISNIRFINNFKDAFDENETEDCI